MDDPTLGAHRDYLARCFQDCSASISRLMAAICVSFKGGGSGVASSAVRPQQSRSYSARAARRSSNFFSSPIPARYADRGWLRRL